LYTRGSALRPLAELTSSPLTEERRNQTPYKTELNGLFWEGTGPKTGAPAFGFRLRADGMDLMAGLFAFPPPALAAYRAAVSDQRQGEALSRILAGLRAHAGYRVQGEQLRRVPAGYAPDHPRAELLRYTGLYALPPPIPSTVVCSVGLVDACMAHFEVLAPLQRWLSASLANAA
jgi:hypothetical protein